MIPGIAAGQHRIVVPANWVVLIDPSPSSVTVFDQTRHYRYRFVGSSGEGNKIRVSFRPAEDAGSGGVTLAACVGVGGAGAYQDFREAPTRLTFGGASSVAIPSMASPVDLLSDAVDFALLPGEELIVSLLLSLYGGVRYVSVSNAPSGVLMWRADVGTSGDEALQTSPAGHTPTGSAFFMISKIEVTL